MTGKPTIHKLASEQLTALQTEHIRALLWAAFADDEHGAFSEDDWQHALGGTHFIATAGGAIVAHASVVERDIHVAGHALRTGYVEAVATAPAYQGRGYGSALMLEVDVLIERDFEFGVLGTGSQGFYERLGWAVWRGPSFVRTQNGEEPTPDEDGYIMFLRTPSTPPIDPLAPISCEWRPGDVW